MVLSLGACRPNVQAATTPAQPTGSLPNGWIEQVSGIVWVAYTPSSSNPNIGMEVTVDEIIADLAVLRIAGFNGLVTYTSAGIMGQSFPPWRRKPVCRADPGDKGSDSQEEYDAAGTLQRLSLSWILHWK
jgi:hypothetical protein